MASGLLLDEDVDDLASVSYVDEAIIVGILRCRFRKRKIFTAVGEILISVNPFEATRKTSNKVSAGDVPATSGDVPPDISVTVARVYQSLVDTKRPQCCIFSGESGSGKTEASKLFLSHLMGISSGDADLERRIVVVNPLLEAFGNAKTSLNSNSSRFGKFIQLTLTETGRGAKISEYLLEKSRVTHRNPGESSFHIFHTVMKQLPAQQLRKLKLDANGFYSYLEDVTSHQKQRSATSAHLQSYEELIAALSVLGLQKEEQNAIFMILAAILLLGNVRFTEEPGGNQPFAGETERFVKSAASLLKIDKQSLKNQLQNLEIYSRGEIICRPYTRAEAEDCRDSISKALYNRLFAWIIHRINQVLCPKNIHAGNTVTIGILDIFGFENLRFNSFEQLCINLANEQLQHFFNLKIFKQEQCEYDNEGLGVDSVSYRDNMDLLSMFLDRPIGLLSLIDEESHFPQGTDASLVTKLIKNFPSANKRFHSTFHPRPGHEILEPTFTVRHYAGDVLYSAVGFLEKNRDSLPDRISVLLQSSSHAVVSSLFRASVSRTGSLLFERSMPADGTCPRPMETTASARSTRRKLTLGYQFKASLSALLDKLQLSETYFVRCIKPNTEQIPGKFDSVYVLTQLRHAGVLETVWIRRQGFSYRPTFGEFMARFRGLFNTSCDGPMALIEKILEPYGCQSWHLGKTKVFVKYSVADDLARRIRIREAAAKRIQRWYRWRLWIRRKKERHNAPDNKYYSIDSTHPADENADPENSSLSTYSDPERNDSYSLADSNQVSQWFKDCVYEQLAASRTRGRPGEVDWFYQDISRKDAEGLLQNRPVGCFLVRTNRSEPTVLVLSFRAPERCRHYLIDLLPDGKMGVRGEMELYSNLTELLNHHRQVPLSNYSGVLTEPCGHQPSARADGGERKVAKEPAEYDQLPPKVRKSHKTKRKVL